MREIIYNRKILKSIRKKLRNNSTKAEKTLWIFLKNKKLNDRKFRRQHSIGNYIVDFYCPKEKIAIELDGELHLYDKVHKQDVKKEKFLNSFGIRVIRFENKQVFDNLEEVIKAIQKFLTTP